MTNSRSSRRRSGTQGCRWLISGRQKQVQPVLDVFPIPQIPPREDLERSTHIAYLILANTSVHRHTTRTRSNTIPVRPRRARRHHSLQFSDIDHAFTEGLSRRSPAHANLKNILIVGTLHSDCSVDGDLFVFQTLASFAFLSPVIL